MDNQFLFQFFNSLPYECSRLKHGYFVSNLAKVHRSQHCTIPRSPRNRWPPSPGDRGEPSPPSLCPPRSLSTWAGSSPRAAFSEQEWIDIINDKWNNWLSLLLARPSLEIMTINARTLNILLQHQPPTEWPSLAPSLANKDTGLKYIWLWYLIMASYEDLLLSTRINWSHDQRITS